MPKVGEQSEERGHGERRLRLVSQDSTVDDGTTHAAEQVEFTDFELFLLNGLLRYMYGPVESPEACSTVRRSTLSIVR